MDLIKIGKYIAEKRKNKKLTQVELAQKLNISEKTISKWECGNGFPDTSLILPLCNELEISSNELLSGKDLKEFEYKESAENNILLLLNEKKESKKKIILACAIVLLTLLASFSLIWFSGILEIPTPARIAMLVIGMIVLIIGLITACIVENDYGSFECRHCGNKFLPTMSAYLLGIHTLTTRYLKCPKCNKKSFCKRRLTKK